VRRLAAIDKILLATLVPVWVTVFALHVRQVVLTGLAEPPVYAFAAREPDGFPVVAAFRPELHAATVGLQVGDRLVRVGDVDLRGAGYLRFYAATLAQADDSLRVPVVFERDGERHSLMLALRRPAIAWYWIPALLGTAVTAVLVLLRAPDVQQARLFFLAIMTFITFCTPFHGRSYALSYLSRGILWYGVGGIGFGLVWLWVICFPGELARRDRLSPLWALFASAVWYTSRINYVTSGFPAAIVPALKGTCDALLMGGGLAIATRNYRRAGPIGRRRVKWLLYGAYIAVVPLIVARTLTIADPDARWYQWVYVATIIGVVGFPLGTLVAIVRYNLFDIDRLITATASYSIVLVGLLGFLLALVPPLARAASTVLGVDRTFAQVASALLLAALAVPLGRRLRWPIERLFFSERYAFERGMQQVLRDLSSCAGPGTVMSLVAERVGNLLRPERLALYTRAGDAFVPTVVRGVRTPPVVDGTSPLLARVADGAAPVALLEPGAATGDASRATRDSLATLGAALVVRLHRGQEIAALLCLGPKRSGDIYTSTDVMLLAAVAEKASSELVRFRDAEIIERGQERVQALRAAKEEADRSNVAKSRFLAVASHDLRQPLHALGLFVGALDDRVHEPGARELVCKIQESMRALEEMFDALLDVSRLDAGVMDVGVADVSLLPLLQRLESEFEPLARRKGLRLRVVPSRLVVQSDPVLLSRILQNLISNAVRYTDRGRIVVGCRRRGATVRLEVADSGRGIAPERRREIFEEFHRLEREPDRGGEGLGLGLSIVERLARLLDHRIDVDSTPGRGSVFAITVPRVSREGRASERETPSLPVQLGGVSVLIVDDDSTVLDATRQQLERWGCRVRAAPSAAEACDPDRLSAAAPDVIVADYQLDGGATGVEAIAAIRVMLGRSVPALLLTGSTSPEALGAARAGGFPLLRKPLAPAKLRAALTQLVRR
jgi:signal transduction histidine kinase/CheY-like chemotaxis protein